MPILLEMSLVLTQRLVLPKSVRISTLIISLTLQKILPNHLEIFPLQNTCVTSGALRIQI